MDERKLLERIDKVVTECVKVIEKSGLSANDAKEVPYHLERAIESCNREMMGHTPFKVYLTEEERFLKEHPQSRPSQLSQ